MPEYQFRWEAESDLEIYRPRRVKRYLIATMGGFFGILVTLRDGRVAYISEGGDFHVGERGRIDLCTSSDGGESWDWNRPIVTQGPDARNQAVLETSDGTLLLTYVHAAYRNGVFDPTGGYRTVYLIRSTDGGRTWSDAQPILENGPTGDHLSPYGKMVELRDGTIILALYRGNRPDGRYLSTIVRSRDGGRTWGDSSTIAEGADETALLSLPSGKLIAMLRRAGDPAAPESRLWQADSFDHGYTWSAPRPITGPTQIPADLLLLRSGRILLTFGHRTVPFGVRALISHDGGETWDTTNQITLAADSVTRDCGYPSSIQLIDGSILTSYYMFSSSGPFRQPALRDQLVGPHGAAVKYREEDLL
jgi:hypothetical protein